MKTTTVFDANYNQDLTVFIGQNASENWKLLDTANQSDFWFHLDDKPSCHVILKIPNDRSGNTKINKQSLIFCAKQCKENSKFAEYKNIKVIYTERKNVSKADVPGSVHTKKTSTIII